MRQNVSEWAETDLSDKTTCLQRRGLRKTALVKGTRAVVADHHLLCIPPLCTVPGRTEKKKKKTEKYDCFRRVQVPNIQMHMTNWWLLSLPIKLRPIFWVQELHTQLHLDHLASCLTGMLAQNIFLKEVHYLPLNLFFLLFIFFPTRVPKSQTRGQTIWLFTATGAWVWPNCFSLKGSVKGVSTALAREVWSPWTT